MKTILKFTALSVILLMLAGGVVSCNDKEIIRDDKPSIFTYHLFSNMLRLDEYLKITADSTYYSFRHGIAKISYQTSIKTSKEQWKNLTRAFNLGIFTKIPVDSYPLLFGSPTSSFSVFINGEIYSVDDPAHDSKYYKQMQDFFNLIHEQRISFRNTMDSLLLLEQTKTNTKK